MEKQNIKIDNPTKEECIVHKPSTKVDIKEKLIQPQTKDSWATLVAAAEIRNHSPILNILPTLSSGEIPNIKYHRKCRSLFTMKKDLDSIKRKIPVPTDKHSDEPPQKRSTRDEKPSSRVFEKICIFCKKTKMQTNNISRENLIMATQLRVDETLRKCATKLNDSNILALTSRDMVAAEAHYHRSCYRKYTQAPATTSNCKHDNEVDHEQQLYKKIEDESYKELVTFFKTSIIPNKQVILISSLKDKLISIIKSKGIKEVKESTKTHIKRNLLKYLGNCINIFSDHEGKSIVVANSVTVLDLVKENQNLKKQLNQWRTTSNYQNVIEIAATHLRAEIQKDAKETPWPFYPHDADPELFVVPEYLKRFFLNLLTDKGNKQYPPQRVLRLIQSFSQDMIYAVTGGKQKTPKHVLLTYAVKTLTGNTEIIHSLNRLGHGISYSQLEENDTALCLAKMAASQDEQAVIPTNIHKHVFTNLAWDNIDRLEETLTGKGTSHRVNGIAVQPKIYGPHLPDITPTTMKKTKQRTITASSTELPLYIAGERKGPIYPTTTFAEQQSESEKIRKVSQGKNLIWMVTREEKGDTIEQRVPSWTGFNIKTRDLLQVSQDSIGYLPTINAPATELSTALEILNQSELIRIKLQIQSIVLVMDQALYAKASEIVWKHEEQYRNIILRMGVFHTICNFLSILGKRFIDAGLRDICIESGILGAGSINGVFDGKAYNRAIRVHKVIYEAFMRVIWSEFRLWLEDDEDEKEKVNLFVDEIKVLREDLNQTKFDGLLNSFEFDAILNLWNKFLDHLRYENGDLSAFWMSYIDMVEGVLLNLLRGSREGNWTLHLIAIRSMIPWCFAYDKMNYARYLTAYYAQMSLLEETNPEVYNHFKNGQFSVQRSNSNTFGRIPVDQTIEVTVNKDTQTQGGTSRFSLKPGAVKRYYITAEYRSAFLHNLRTFVEQGSSEAIHTDLQSTRIEKDEHAVLTVMNVVEGWVNPFHENELTIISTGKEATSKVNTDLLNALKIGEAKYDEFKNKRIDANHHTKKFHDPLPMSKLESFSSMCKKHVVKSQGKEIILKADRALFAKIILTSQARDLKMKDVLCHSLGPLPWPLATPEGDLRKTNKAKLALTLKKDVDTAENIPENCATIIDGMHLVQKMKGDQLNFGEIAIDLFSMVLKEGAGSKRIDVVFDRYQDISIKNKERESRGKDSGIKINNITSSQIIRQWKKFLGQNSNKTCLITYLVKEWSTPKCTEKLNGKVLFATCEENCYKISSDSVTEVPELNSSQEEADGRLLLHANNAAAAGYQAVIISSPDTDVFILCLHFQKYIKASLFQKCGNKNRTKLLDIKKIVSHVGEEVCETLIGLHAFTGCDSVSAFAGKGKVSALKKINCEDTKEVFSKLGSDWNLSDENMKALEIFTCSLYSPKASTNSINELRYLLFCSKKGEIESHQLPPCLDSLRKHAERANYQAAIWKRSLEKYPDTPTPIGRGWKLIETNGKQQLEIDWMDGLPAPQALLDLLSCKCSKSCKLPKCICLVNGLKCTEMCSLSNCSNQETKDDFCEEEEEEDTDDDEFNVSGFEELDFCGFE
jgi:hypothetical protein